MGRRLRRREYAALRRRAGIAFSQAKDEEQFKELFTAKSAEAGLDPATILLLLQIALQLYEWWRKRNVSEPGDSPVDGEPVFAELEDDRD